MEALRTAPGSRRTLARSVRSRAQATKKPSARLFCLGRHPCHRLGRTFGHRQAQSIPGPAARVRPWDAQPRALPSGDAAAANTWGSINGSTPTASRVCVCGGATANEGAGGRSKSDRSVHCNGAQGFNSTTGAFARGCRARKTDHRDVLSRASGSTGFPCAVSRVGTQQHHTFPLTRTLERGEAVRDHW